MTNNYYLISLKMKNKDNGKKVLEFGLQESHTHKTKR